MFILLEPEYILKGNNSYIIIPFPILLKAKFKAYLYKENCLIINTSKYS
jgi:hypothetical protein